MTHAPGWSNAYIGIPHVRVGATPAGCSCWGLAVLIYGRELGLTIPPYDDVDVAQEEATEPAAIIAGERNGGLWMQVPEAGQFDLVLFRAGRWDAHVGVVIDRRHMIHVPERRTACVEQYRADKWATRLVGAFRHRDLVGRAP